MALRICHSDPLLAEAFAALLGREGSFPVRGVWDSLRGAIAEGASADVLIAPEDSLSTADFKALRAWRESGGKLLVLATGDTLAANVAELADAVVRQSSGSGPLFERLEALGAKRAHLTVAEPGAAYLGVHISKNEARAAGLLAKGHSNQAIAEAMGVSEQSVKNYFRQLMRKLGCKNRVQLLLKLSGKS